MTDKSVTILHVDDDDSNRYAVTRSLQHAGFSVVEAATGAEALHKAADKPDLIILDVRLPDIDGFEVCRRIKRDPATSTIPVLHLSASRTTSRDKAFGLDGGAEGYLIRPVEPVELIATVNALLRVKRTEAALQERDQQFKALIEGVRDYAIFALDVSGKVVSWHIGAEIMTGYTREEALGMHCSRLHAGGASRDADVERELKAAAESGECKAESVLMRKDGTTFDAACVLTATRSADGQLLGFLKLLHDISLQKRLEVGRAAQLASEQSARMESERVGRMKDEFLATLSHEIRTPLNAILGWSQIVKRSNYATNDVIQGIDVIERNARAQSQIIEDLLDMSRIISGKIRLDIQPIDFVAIVLAAIDSAKPSASAKGIHLTLNADGNSTYIYGDPNRLQQVLWNLLNNAIKFTPRGGSVSISLGIVRSSIELHITDTGEGMDADFLPHVFDRFRQADASTTRNHAGLGLGLSIVKQLVEMHGGRVAASSAGIGRGSTFTTSLPLAATQPDPATDSPLPNAAASRPIFESDGRVPGIQGIRVLVVDDEADSRSFIERLLNESRAIVTQASSVAEAIEMLENRRFDVLLSDIGMPHEDGYSLARRVRQLKRGENANIPAIALTAYARIEDRTAAVAAGFSSHLAKPIEASQLIREIARVAVKSE